MPIYHSLSFYFLPAKPEFLQNKTRFRSWLTAGLPGFFLLWIALPCLAQDNDWKDGLDTYDLVLIKKHILGIQPLDSPYKIIAADANKSHTVTTIDLVLLRRLILGITNNIENNTSWRFVPADYVFPDPTNPWLEDFPESSTVASFPATEDFVAIKVGDVNLSCTANCFNGPTATEQRSAKKMELGLPQISVKKGGEFLLPFYWNGEQPVDGMQMGLRLDPALLQVEGVVNAGATIKASAFNLKDAERGVLRMSWVADLDTGLFASELKKGQILFALQVRAEQDLDDASRAVHLDDGVLQNETYGRDGTHYGLALGAYAEEGSGDFRVKCYPNPSSTSLTFEIEPQQPGRATLMLFDNRGRRVWHKALWLEKGKNTLKINEAEALPIGVLMWKVIRRGAYASGYFIRH